VTNWLKLDIFMTYSAVSSWLCEVLKKKKVAIAYQEET
jgi:hypothetical protein